jgi:phosphate transport system protein
MLVVMLAWLAVEPWVIQPLMLNEFTLSGVDPQQVNAFKMDLVRIGDHAAHISRIAIRLAELPHIDVPQSMHTIYQQSKLMLRKSLLAFVEADSTMAETVLRMDEEVDALCKATMPGQIELIRGNPEEVEQRLMVITACRQLECIGDHAANIAEDVIYLLSGDIIRHGIVARPTVHAT